MPDMDLCIMKLITKFKVRELRYCEKILTQKKNITMEEKGRKLNAVMPTKY